MCVFTPYMNRMSRLCAKTTEAIIYERLLARAHSHTFTSRTHDEFKKAKNADLFGLPFSLYFLMMHF